MKKCVKNSLKSEKKRVKAVSKTSEKCMSKIGINKNTLNYEQIQKTVCKKLVFRKPFLIV